jgi:hypothetical protein
MPALHLRCLFSSLLPLPRIAPDPADYKRPDYQESSQEQPDYGLFLMGGNVASGMGTEPGDYAGPLLPQAQYFPTFYLLGFSSHRRCAATTLLLEGEQSISP